MEFKYYVVVEDKFNIKVFSNDSSLYTVSYFSDPETGAADYSDGPCK